MTHRVGTAAVVLLVVGAAMSAQRTMPQTARGGAPPVRGGPLPGSLIWTDKCAGCHGTATEPGRAPNLFDEAWLARSNDALITSTIRTGVSGTEMPAFASTLDDLQVFQLIQYIRTQTAIARPPQAFIRTPHDAVVQSEKQEFRIELVADDLMTPWALAFLPDGRLLITERDGRLRVVDRGRLSGPVRGAPATHVQQDGGYLDVELHPDFARNRWIYLAYSEGQPGYGPPAGATTTVPSMTVIVRGRLNDRNEWTDQQVIYRAPAELYTTDGSHYGCRMIFDRQNHLFFTLGERGFQPNAQDLETPLGKIHRVNDDGSVPTDNPFVNTPGAVPSIWSSGHRNPEGLAWDPVSGVLWESEHGPNTADEINIIEKGRNYGWALAAKSAQPGVELSLPGMDDPIVYFTPTFAPAGIAFYTANRYPEWKNTSLFVGGLRGQALRRFEIKGRSVVKQEVVFNQYGRVRDIVQSPDGYFYLALQDPTGVPDSAGEITLLSASTAGRVIRLMPVP
jgi:aldose sugar dehydrogenase